jgi:hypothetical protein
MQELLASYCQLLGYASCSTMSTFEALVAFGAFAYLFYVLVRAVSFVATAFSQR